MDKAALEQLLLDISLKPNTVKETLRNEKVSQKIVEVVELTGLKKCDEKTGSLIYGVATKLTESIEKFRKLLADYVAQKKILSAQQLDMALAYLKEHASQDKIDSADFDKSIGVGVVVTDAQIQATVDGLLNSKKEELLKIRYTADLGGMLRKIREDLPFADGAKVATTFNTAIANLLGPQTEEDKKMKAEAAKKKPEPAKKPEAENAKQDEEEEEEKKIPLSSLIARDLNAAVNPPEILKKHLEFTQGKIFTRFPPEPNGYLHIGHAKAMRFSFNTAREYGGNCYLRYDDTNPDRKSVV